MSSETHSISPFAPGDLTRRDVVTASLATSWSVIAGEAGAAGSSAAVVVGTDVSIKTADGPTKLRPLMASVNAPGAAEQDAAAFTAFLDAQPQVDRSKKIGVRGYCMGGAIVVRTAAAVPERIGAGASFHGGGPVTDKPGSPHLLASKIKARMYFGVASNDDEKQPDAKAALKAAFAAANNAVAVDVYPAKHGWCVPDMPNESGMPICDHASAEQAWSTLLTFYRAALD